MKIAKIVCFLISFFSTCAISQNYYFVQFTDKNQSIYSVSNPAEFISQRTINQRLKHSIAIVDTDLPVNQAYITKIKAEVSEIKYSTKWLNGIVVTASESQIANITAFPFVKKISLLKGLGKLSFRKEMKENQLDSALQYGTGITETQMLGIDLMHSQSFTGKNIRIAIMDNGFVNANKIEAFFSIFSNNRMILTADLVENDNNVFNSGRHGLNVWSCMAANSNGKLIGAALDAEYMLFHTEDDRSESKLEELNWARAAEMADSAGVNIINTSLGYTTFDNLEMNYSQDDLNGNTTFIAQAATIASKKGILIVCSAGNEGAAIWKKISSPSDADGILSVGATDRNGVGASFSSFGPSADGRVKPDVSAMGSSVTVISSTGDIVNQSGTSFAAPLVSGLAAGIWQKYPDLSSFQLREIIIKGSSKFVNPDNKLGHGIPFFKRIDDYASQLVSQGSLISNGKIYPNPFKSGSLYLNLTNENKDKYDFLKIVNNQGQILFNIPIKQEIWQNLEIDFQTLKLGVYNFILTGKNSLNCIKGVKLEN